MTNTEKINSLKKSLIDHQLNSFEYKLNEVLSICESEIEKLFFLELFNYFQKFDSTPYDEGLYSNVDFILDEIDTFDPEVDKTKQIELTNKVTIQQYKKEGYFYYKYIGFKVSKNRTEAIIVDNLLKGCEPFYFQFEVIPQLEVETKDGKKRIDFALIATKLKPFVNDKIETKKIALECDGFDYHSRPEQYRKDKERERHLKSKGWTDVLRYSGSEIYRIDNNFKKTHFIIDEIIKILTL